MTIDIDALADQMLDACRGLIARDVAEGVAKAAERIKTEMLAAVDGAVTKAVAAIPVPKDGRDVDPETVRSMVETAVADVRRDQEQFVDDQATAFGILRNGVEDALKEAVAAIPRPADGKSVDPADVRAMVAEAVAEIPPAQAGKDADPAVIAEMVAKAVAEIEKPKDGRDADPIEMQQMIDSAVSEAVKAIPAPKDGESVDPEAVRLMVKEAVAEIPRPQDGKSVDPESVKAMVEEAVSKIPPAVDGKDADLEEVKSYIDKGIVQAVKALPTPVALPSIESFVSAALPAVDLSKSYRAGTLANHGGGLIYAERQTDPSGAIDGSGWRVLLRGLSHLEADETDSGIVIRAVGTDGIADEVNVEIPVMDYRGVFDMAEQYVKGEFATYRGSVWHCNQKSQGRVPGTGPEWTLAVKGSK